MSALTETYVDNVIGHLPENSRADIAAEIRATINDMVEDRLGEFDHPAEEQSAAAERQVLEELGDPIRLSREYTNSPQHLIGPAFYPLYIWSLRWVLPTVAVLSVLTNVIVHIATTSQIRLGALLGQTIGSTVTALLIAFAVITILISLGERGLDGGTTQQMSGPRPRAWSVDDLRPKDTKGAQARAEAVLNLIFITLLAAIPLVPTSLVHVGHLNDGETFINPDLGTPWLLGYWAFLALMAAIEIVKLARSSAAVGLLVTGMVIDVAMAVFLTIALLTQPVLHPELTSAANANVQQIITVIAIWIIVVWDQVTTWRTVRGWRRR
ncbi:MULTISPECIES: hypothetical protein [unclassified Brevibacterium]|uniref:HAAS signaling domain-containing protein n=1 Tax=unclassified Brevibacterium TaxID=2614124 RepID=UPI001BA82883|nr:MULTISPECIES: hypothetical protein [unclassified Brevibacterium]QUL79869.1 hypothetical protein IG171_03185 [Brevibacterium sp. SMBL_HHYL_HB1]